MSPFYLLLSHLLLIHCSPTNDSKSEIVREKLSSSWLESNNDFIQPLPNSDFFPFTKSKLKNEETKRDNYEKINSNLEAEKLTNKLYEWRGFEDLDQDVSGVFQRFIGEYENFPSSLRSAIMSKFESGQHLAALPSSWFNFMEKSQVDIGAKSLAKFINEQGLDTATLYRIIILLRDVDTEERNGFIPDAEISEYLADHVGYLLGYRWSFDNKTELPLKTLMTLPADVILNMSDEVLSSLGIEEKIRSPGAFLSANQEKQNAWVARFTPGLESEASASLIDEEGFQRYGHLLNGAGLRYLADLNNHSSRSVLEEGMFEVLKNSPISSIRVCSFLKNQPMFI